jgi:TolB-like protein
MTEPPAASPGEPEAPSPQPARTARDAPGFEEFWARLKEHKVLQWTLAYAAAAYTLLHVAEMVGGAFHWPEIVIQVTTVTLALGVPVAIILAWYHGHKATHGISGPELTMITIMLVIAGSVLWALARNNEARPLVPATATTGASTPAAPRTAVAVLPFVNLTGDTTKEYLGDGMAEELINTLAKVPGLKVPARTSTFAYKGRNTDIRQIAKDLGVGTILEGSVRAAGKRIRITAQLINAQDGLHLWSDTYDEDFTDIFKLQDRLATQIATALQPNLSGAAQAAVAQAPPTRDVEAYDLYMQGLSLLSRLSAANEERAIDYFQRALTRDPGFARAHAMIAEAHMYWATLGGKDQAEHHQAAERAARQALALDPNLANAHTALSGIYQGRLQLLEMANHLSAALTLAPNSGDIRMVAMIDTYGTGRLRGALEEASKGYELAPANATVVAILAYAHSLVGDDAAALKYASAARDLGLPRGVYPLADVALMSALRNRHYAEATAIVEATADPADADEVRAAQVLRRVFAALADPAQRRSALAAAPITALVPGGLKKLGPCLTGAVSYVLLDALDTAYESVDRCLDQLAPGATHHVAALELSWWMPEFRSFRADPRFQAFVSRMGLMEYWQEYGPPDDCDLKDGKLRCH